MRRFVATVATALGLAGVGVAIQTATSEATADAGGQLLLPYVEQENVYRLVELSG